MDALRLLTRSTTFAKKGTSTKTAIQTPSSGPASNPQLFDHGNDSQASQRKRKRGSETLTASLDFFGGGASAKEGEVEQKEVDSLEEQQEKAAPVALSSEECKQLLGRHKVKITLFRSETEAPAKKKTKKDRSDKQNKASNDHATPLYPAPVSDFGSLASRYPISKALLRNIKDNGYSTTTEVQLAALPLLLDSRPHPLAQEQVSDQQQDSTLQVDLLSIAPTGSGKTLAFMIPLIHALLLARRTNTQSGPQAIILAPTKELASQIANEGRKLAVNTAIRITNVRKGMHLASDPSSDADAAEKEVPPVKADILVSTPAALQNAIGDANTSSHALSQIRFLVLDEADVLLDPLFRDQTLAVWNALSNPNLRLGFWSATMGSNIEELVKATIKSRAERLSETTSTPIQIAPFVRLVVGLKDSAVPNVDHRLIYAATEQGKLMALRQLLHPTSTGVDKQPVVRAPFLIFTQTIERAVALHSELLYDIPAEAGGISRISVLHSDLSDTARDHVMTRFRKGEVWILITTDLLSRGVDFRGINAVINYDA
ncbi:P-loop containing nucleoside triphosphate hydrolase protein, partial [Aureobasidium sp. EXF-8846]